MGLQRQAVAVVKPQRITTGGFGVHYTITIIRNLQNGVGNYLRLCIVHNSGFLQTFQSQGIWGDAGVG